MPQIFTIPIIAEIENHIHLLQVKNSNMRVLRVERKYRCLEGPMNTVKHPLWCFMFSFSSFRVPYHSHIQGINTFFFFIFTHTALLPPLERHCSIAQISFNNMKRTIPSFVQQPLGLTPVEVGVQYVTFAPGCWQMKMMCCGPILLTSKGSKCDASLWSGG